MKNSEVQNGAPGRAVVLGNGASGKAAAGLLRGEGWTVLVLDGDDAWPDGRFGLCVTSPGIPLDHVWQKAARASGVRVVSELQLGAERYAAMGGRMLAVTGSKGKSSVVKLVADALGGVPCGNYGKPLCEVVTESQGGVPPVAVVEVSSFQMETTELPPGTFEAAAVLNLQEDHLDRHGSADVYRSLKKRLLGFASVGITPDAASAVPDADALLRGSYFDNPVLRENGLCAVALLRAAGAADDVIREAFGRFKPLPHRMQTVAEPGGVTYIDDSKATSVSALVAGVRMAVSRFGRRPPRVRLIAGGLAKGDDPRAARGILAEGVAGVYLIGRCADDFAAAWNGVVSCVPCGDLDTAVRRAAADASSGDCVLLSPGTASFDQFRGYGERGDRFCRIVAEINER